MVLVALSSCQLGVGPPVRDRATPAPGTMSGAGGAGTVVGAQASQAHI